MPRRSKGPRLYLDPKRKQYIIRDGARFIRTGCGERDGSKAEKFLAEYIGRKHKPEPSSAPMIADVLSVYGNDVALHTKTARNISYSISNLLKWWGDKTVADISKENCREYVRTKTDAMGYADLKFLRAAANYWHKNKQYGPLASIPDFWFPDPSQPRERWLTKSEAARLLCAARPPAGSPFCALRTRSQA